MELNEQTDNRIKADPKIAALSPEIKKLMDQLVSDMVKEDIARMEHDYSEVRL